MTFAHRAGHSRKLVQVIRGGRGEFFPVRQSSLEACLPLLDEQWQSGGHNGAGLWRRLTARGFRGLLRLSASGRPGAGEPSKPPTKLQKVAPARTIARLLTTARNYLGKADTKTITAIEAQVPRLRSTGSTR